MYNVLFKKSYEYDKYKSALKLIFLLKNDLTFSVFQGRKLSGDRRAYSNICLGLNEIDELSLLMKKLET